MNDKELLELAAKAAGIEGEWYDNPFGSGFMTAYIGNADVAPWNPLTDDGDALRLAVKLSIDLEFWAGFEEIRAGTEDIVCVEPYGYENFEATRRAIVRAAAEIGRGME